ncbi:hypothetical protein NC653_003591 [Populus alba x Populus x berolinensis]|uniref:Uncharacterized protein n=1 Tax=Populus alba x Populus x berolinensis TaxID=444605 RepID=A0AAD6RRV5_9ROSI|nr:hypothetical protein NC653_003591 [Populus alba x Populus x berolinensis]
MGQGEMGNYRNREGEENGWGMGEWDGNNGIITEPNKHKFVFYFALINL